MKRREILILCVAVGVAIGVAFGIPQARAGLGDVAAFSQIVIAELSSGTTVPGIYLAPGAQLGWNLSQTPTGGGVNFLTNHIEGIVTPTYASVLTGGSAPTGFAVGFSGAAVGNACHLTPLNTPSASVILDGCTVQSANTITIWIANGSNAALTPTGPTDFNVELWQP